MYICIYISQNGSSEIHGPTVKTVREATQLTDVYMQNKTTPLMIPL